MVDSNVPIGAGQSYPEKSASLNRDVIDAMKEVIAIKGEKGDIPDHEWSGTQVRFQNPDGSWGDWHDVEGPPGDDAPAVLAQYSNDGINKHPVYVQATDQFIHFSFDGGLDNYPVVILFKGTAGIKGDTGALLRIQYSPALPNWYDTPQAVTEYIRFSTDGGQTWSAAIYVLGTDGEDGLNTDEVMIQFSVSGSSWHTLYVPGTDKFIRFSTDAGTSWLVSDRFIGTDGIDGDDGTNQYLYVGWASDDQGTDFTLNHSPSLYYRAELQTTVPIVNPLSTNFVGLWKYVRGTAGADGASAYLYLAYASDDQGTGFSLIPTSGLDYLAVLNTIAYVDPITLTANDFEGLWRYSRGPTGEGSFYIELPNAGKVEARCDGIIEQPIGWVIDSADVLTNPLSTSSKDLVIQHNRGIEVVDVVVKSIIFDRQIKLIGPIAYSRFEDDTALNWLCIVDFSETASALGIFIKFAS